MDDVKTVKLLQNLDKEFEFGAAFQALLQSNLNQEIEDVLNDVKDAFYSDDNFYDQDLDYLSYFWIPNFDFFVINTYLICTFCKQKYLYVDQSCLSITSEFWTSFPEFSDGGSAFQ